jgi:arylsulfatase A-like enzyme
MLPADYDPDDLLGITQCYAGQILLLDTCLGALWEFLDAGPAGRDTLIVLLSARGFPLGEHRHIGGGEYALYSELVHVPLMVRMPDRVNEAARSQALVHPMDVRATLLDWWGIENAPRAAGAGSLLPIVREEIGVLRDRLCLTDGIYEKAIRTPAWYLRDPGAPELFAKPDDRWEVNDVADRCGEFIEPLQAALSEFEKALESEKVDELSLLDDALLYGID